MHRVHVSPSGNNFPNIATHCNHSPSAKSRRLNVKDPRQQPADLVPKIRETQGFQPVLAGFQVNPLGDDAPHNASLQLTTNPRNPAVEISMSVNPHTACQVKSYMPIGGTTQVSAGEKTNDRIKLPERSNRTHPSYITSRALHSSRSVHAR